MARCPSPRILAIIRSCGLAPSKARNLRAMAGILVDEHGGRVPASFEALEALPGVGHKTASVVMAQAFGHDAFPVDTHIHRLAARWGLSSGKNVEQTERDLKRALPQRQLDEPAPADHLLRPRALPRARHDLLACPICAWAASKARIAAEARTRPARPARTGA